MTKLIHWIHHLLNPHCVECKDESTESRICQSCETLKMQLSIANIEKQRLLDALLEKGKPEIEQVKVVSPENLKNRSLIWNVRRQMLEAEDRAKAEILRKEAEAKKETDAISKLEKEVGLNTEGAKESA